jgi:hypothetical protein
MPQHLQLLALPKKGACGVTHQMSAFDLLDVEPLPSCDNLLLQLMVVLSAAVANQQAMEHLRQQFCALWRGTAVAPAGCREFQSLRHFAVQGCNVKLCHSCQ